MADHQNIIILKPRQAGHISGIASQCVGVLRLAAEGREVMPDSLRTASAWALRELQMLRQTQELQAARTSMACQRVWLATQRRAISISDIADHLIAAHEELVDAHHIVGLLQETNGEQGGLPA